MRTVRATKSVPGTVHEVEQRWYDTERWPFWVDGLDRVLEVTGEWPRQGASVIWESGPAGRGRVVERVVAHEPLAGQTVDVGDPSIRGRQTVSFTPDGEDGVDVELSLAYELERRSPVTAVVDLLFIRRAMTTSLATTLGRFAAEVAARRSRSRS
jgi:hypothetical protein